MSEKDISTIAGMLIGAVIAAAGIVFGRYVLPPR
jgi:gas vesicle protein